MSVEQFGADLSAGYAVDILGFRVLSNFKKWPLVGKGCEEAASGPAAALSSLANSAPAGDFPTAGQAQVALGPDGWVAAVWIESPDGPAGSQGDVFLQLTHPSALRRTVRLTVDVGADQAPHVAFDKQGRALVVWQRNAVFTGNPSLEQLDAFAAGFEIARALIDPATGQVLDSGLLTTNALFDFGATLQANADGDVLLTWGQSKRVFGGGDAQDPASIYGAIWDGTAWSASESIATHLQGNFGWRAAFGSNQTAAVAFVLDGDLDFATTADRELYLVQRSDGTWGTPSRITSNTLDDRFPALRFMPDNRLAVAWVQGSQVVGLLVGNASTPSVWIQTNDWVGLSFAHAELVASGSKLFAVWPAANDLYIAQLPIDPAASTTPSQPTVLHADPLAVETAFAATLDELQQLRYVAVSHPVSQTEDGLPILAERSGFTSGTKDLRPSVSASPRIRDVQALTPSKFRLTWASPAGKRYTIQSSTDLRAWVDESVGSATQAETAADLEVSPGLKAKFFRIKLD